MVSQASRATELPLGFDNMLLHSLLIALKRSEIRILKVEIFHCKQKIAQLEKVRY